MRNKQNDEETRLKRAKVNMRLRSAASPQQILFNFFSEFWKIK